jgi:hypothetical protein
MPKILYKFPCKSRPEKFFAALDNLHQLSEQKSFKVLATLDVDDPTAHTQTFRDRLKQYDTVLPMWGFSKGKVSAINRDMEFSGDWDILVLISDDMKLLPGFDTEIVKAFEDGFSGLVHFPDGYANERLVTFPVMDRKYYQLDNYIYNPAYVSVFCDNEQMFVAQKRGMYKYVNKKIVIHEHAIWGHGEPDALLRHTESFYEVDRPTFLRRQAENFGLPK